MAIISGLLALPACTFCQRPQRHPMTGGGIFDLQIIATMQANNVACIYTFNADFKVFSELTVVAPSSQTPE